MKSKDIKTLHLKSLQELNKEVTEAKDMLTNLQLDKMQNKLKNPRQISLKRKEIAQMLTIIRELELSKKVQKV